MKTLEEAEVSAAIEMAEGFEPGSTWIESGVLWRTDAEGFLKSVCAMGTPYWFEQAAALITRQILAKVAQR
jgi:hypothetical protein